MSPGPEDEEAARSRAAAELRDSEERYRRLVELLPDALMLVAHGRVTFVNPAAVRLAEASSATEMIGRRITDFAPPDLAAVLEARARGALRRGDRATRRVQGRFVRADGSVVPVEVSAIPLTVRGESCLQVVIRDLSDQQAATAALHRSEEQLRQSQKMEAVGRLAGGIAHDFNNILTAISGFASLLEAEIDADSPKHQYVEEIRRATDRAAGLTRQLLAFGRRQVLSPIVLDVNAAVRDMGALMQRVLGEDTELVLDLSADDCRVLVDRGQFEQVLMNLVDNARDAMEHGGRLTVETGRTMLDESFSQGRFALVPGEYVVMAVRDTGRGMDAATIERVFEPFFTTKHTNHGSGLGLATVYGIVKQSGGFVWAESEPGHGTSMTVYLPRVEASSTPEPKPAPQAPARPAAGRILLVEDERAVRLLTRTILSRTGYEVLEADNGEVALELAERIDGKIDLLLTDVVMPRMGGRELADRLSALRPGIRVVYFSGYAEHAIARHGILEEGRVLLQKPFTAEALLDVVRTALAD